MITLENKNLSFQTDWLCSRAWQNGKKTQLWQNIIFVIYKNFQRIYR